MHKHINIPLWIILILFNLTGCLVDSDKVPQVFGLGSNILHTYQDGDWINYVVSGSDQATNTPIRGQLSISWSANISIQEPLFGTETVNVVKETTELSINTGPDEFSNGIVRFISQESIDPTKLGTYYVRAYDDLSNYFWLSDQQAPSNISEIIRIESLTSPLPDASSLPTDGPTNAYWVLQGCDASSQCNSPPVAQTMQIYTVETTEIVDTNLGRFKAYRISFSDTSNNTNSANLLLAIPHFCAVGGSADIIYISSSGNYWVSPEVGIIKYDFVCLNLNNNETTKFVASISGTNIKLPAKK